MHDAILGRGTIAEIDEHVAALKACMREAGRIVLDGLELGSDAKIVRRPDRCIDKRGEVMWATVTRLLDDLGHGTEHRPPAGSA